MLHWCSALVWAGKGSFCFIWGQFTFLVQQFPSDMCLSAERVDIVCVPFESRRRKKFCIVSRQKAIAWVPSVPETNCWTDKKLLLFQNFNFKPLSRLSIIVHKYQKSYSNCRSSWGGMSESHFGWIFRNVILHWREEGCIRNYAPRGPRDLPKYWFCPPRPERLPEGEARGQSRGPRGAKSMLRQISRSEGGVISNGSRLSSV